MESRDQPCRLFGILARQAPMGVILRRGPSKWVQLNVWHLDTDTVEYGQWFHGRIYEHRCDLSPDGSLFIYRATKYGQRQPTYVKNIDSWTAISKPPYLTALALWPEMGTWFGGGLFMDHKTVWLNGSVAVPPSTNRHAPIELSAGESVRDSDGVYYKRLERDRWVMTQQGAWPEKFSTPYMAVKPAIWQKQRPNRQQTLVMKILGYNTKQFGSPYVLEISIQDSRTGSENHLEGVEWVEWDQRNRLVFAKDGCLFVDELDQPEQNSQLIADFNGQQHHEVETPEWAKSW